MPQLPSIGRLPSEGNKMSWKKSEALMETIKHYSSFPATGVSLRQMVQFGERPSIGGDHLNCLETQFGLMVFVQQERFSARPNSFQRSSLYD